MSEQRKKHMMQCLALLLAVCILALPGMQAAFAADAPMDASRAMEAVHMTLDDPESGTFTIEAQEIPDEHTDVHVRIRCSHGEDLTIDLPMERHEQTWTAAASVKDFHCMYGRYEAAAWSPSEDDSKQIWGTTSLLIGPAGQPEAAARPTGPTQQFWRLTLSGTELPGSPDVWFEVKSETGNEAPAVYPAQSRDGLYRALMPVGASMQPGRYLLSAMCGEYPDYKACVANSTFTVDGIEAASVVFENVDPSAGTFRVRANAEAPSGIAAMRAAVWSADDQSDILWTQMTEDGDSWRADFDIGRDFGRHFGHYRAHVYAVLKNGLQTIAAAAETQIAARNHIWCENPQSGTYLVHVMNPDPKGPVRVAVWSDASGQDDLVWYDAEASGDGQCTARVRTRRHRSGGLFHAHAYTGSTLLAATGFAVPESDIRDLPAISNPPTKRWSWYFMRRSDGKVPEGAWTSEQLRPYDAYYVGDTSRKVIYLAFDAGYDNGNTGRILDVLKRNDVPAAFFVTKGTIDYSPELVRRMAREGHVVGNHTVHHPDMTKLSEARLAAEIQGCADRYKEVTGQEMDPFLRPPEGVFSGQSMLRTRNQGYTTIFWSLAYNDWNENAQPSVKEAYNRIVGSVHPGCITLLHTVSSANAGALESAIRTLRAQGYEFASLYDLP